MLAIYNEHSPEMLGTGTGFVAQTNVGLCLVTARHCCTGRDHFTGKLRPNGAIPSEVRIYHRFADENGKFRDICLIRSEKLYDVDGNPTWYEYPKYPGLCDFVFIPLADIEGCAIYPVNLKPGLIELTSVGQSIEIEDGFVKEGIFDIYVGVGEPVSVIGYPFGAFTGSGLPLWTTGYVSSEPDMRFSFSPQFIDCRARRGQSGSPVYLKRRGEIPIRGSDSVMIDGYCYSFIGLYSGRINDQSDIGLVWTSDIIYDASISIKAGEAAEFPVERRIGGPISRLGQRE